MHVMKCFSVELDASSFEIAIRRLEIGNTGKLETLWKEKRQCGKRMRRRGPHVCHDSAQVHLLGRWASWSSSGIKETEGSLLI